MGFDDDFFPNDFVTNQRRPFFAENAKRISDSAPITASQAANQAALTTILNNIQTAAMAGNYFINVDTTTLTGADIPYLVNVLHARLGYTVQTIATNMNIDWSFAGYGRVGSRTGLRGFFGRFGF